MTSIYLFIGDLVFLYFENLFELGGRSLQLLFFFLIRFSVCVKLWYNRGDYVLPALRFDRSSYCKFEPCGASVILATEPLYTSLWHGRKVS